MHQEQAQNGILELKLSGDRTLALATVYPSRTDGEPVPDWLALDPRKLVVPGQELASIVPSQPGVAGQTLTWPIQPVPAKAGKPPNVRSGANVHIKDGTKVEAAGEGYVCLHGDMMT